MYVCSSGLYVCVCACVCVSVSVYIHAYISWQLATKVAYASLHVVACPCLRDCVAPPPRFEDIHSQLVPYLLTIGSFALEHGTSAIRPLAKHDSWLNKVRTTETLKLRCPCVDGQLLGAMYNSVCKVYCIAYAVCMHFDRKVTEFSSIL